MKLLLSEPRPASVHLATANAAADHEHGRRVAVIRSAVAVFGHRPAELRHRQDGDVGHAIAEILRERGQRRRELAEPVGELASLVALAHVGVPAADVREGDLEPDVGANQLCDLAQRLPEPSRWIAGAVGRCQALGIRLLEQSDGLERLAPGAVEEIADALCVE